MKLKIYTPDHSIRLCDKEEYDVAKKVYGNKAVVLGLPTGKEPENPNPILMEVLYTEKGKAVRKQWIQSETGPVPDYS